MKVDGYELSNKSIADVIDKLTEADGSPSDKISYLCDAAKVLALTIAEIAEELAVDKYEELQS